MPNYFVKRNKFVPPGKESDLPVLDAITGTLESCDVRAGNNSTGWWVVVRLKRDDDTVNVFFNSDNVGDDIMIRLHSLLGKTITLRSDKETPVIDIAGVKDEGSIRVTLLKGVAAGNIKAEDLPALLEFAKGKNEVFEKWSLFKQQIENEGLAKVKDNLDKVAKDAQDEIERREAKINELDDIKQGLLKKQEEMLSGVDKALMLLLGEDPYQGGYAAIPRDNESKNFVRIGKSYDELMSAFEEFRVKKGVFVISDGKIHLIHHAYLEDNGRAFLIGSSKEYLKTKPEDVKRIIDRIMRVLYGS